MDQGWRLKEINPAFSKMEKKRFSWIYLSISIVFVLIVVFGYIYFFVISSTFVKKPEMKNPFVNTADQSLNLAQPEINNTHIEYVVNELGGYKLHEDPLKKEIPEIELVISDINQVFDVKIENNEINCSPGKAKKPDLRITGKKEDILLLLQSDDLPGDIVKMVKEGKIQMQMIADEKTLALKGYKSIYDGLNG